MRPKMNIQLTIQRKSVYITFRCGRNEMNFVSGRRGGGGAGGGCLHDIVSLEMKFFFSAKMTATK